MNPNPLASALRKGWDAAKGNFVPGLFLQSGLVAVFLLYFLHAESRAFLDRVAEFKDATGYLFAFVAALIAGGVLPVVMKVLVFRGGKFGPAERSDLVFMSLLMGFMGVVVDALYRFQTVLFGSGTDLRTMVSKIAVDQFVFTTFLFIPFQVGLTTWRREKWTLPALRRVFTRGFVLDQLLPVMIACWALWIPMLCVIYAMPAGLQVPVYVFVVCFWMMIFTAIGEAASATSLPKRRVDDRPDVHDPPHQNHP